MKEWFERFKEWVRHEPVQAAENVRIVLFGITALLAATGVEVEATAVSGTVTALFSIYASRKARSKVSPVDKDPDPPVYVDDDTADTFEEAFNEESALDV